MALVVKGLSKESETLSVKEIKDTAGGHKISYAGTAEIGPHIIEGGLPFTRALQLLDFCTFFLGSLYWYMTYLVLATLAL